MRRTLTALILFSATLFILQLLPEGQVTVVRGTAGDGRTMEQWVQSTVDDFEAGELECLVLRAVADGEIALAKEQEGSYCAEGVLTSEVHEMSVLFNVLGSAWMVEKPMGTSFHLEVRVSNNGHQWSDWLLVMVDEDGPGSEPLVHGNLLETPQSRYLQYRLTLGTFDLDVSPVLGEVVLTAMNTRDGPTVDEARAMIVPQESTSGVPQPRIISRKGWGANEAWATRKPVYRTPTHFVIHHTVTTNNPSDPAYIVRAIYQYHAVSRGWGDIGYNFLIDRQGNIYEGRKGGDGVVGVHAGDFNYGSVGIALLGDYRTVDMTPAMKEALVSLMAWEADRFGIHPLEMSHFVHREFPNVVAHRDLWSTICPGDRVYQALGDLRRLTWQRLLAHDPRVEILSPMAGESVSGEVEIQVSSPSPTTSKTRLLVDGTLEAEGGSVLTWEWDTSQVAEGRHLLEAVATSAEGRRVRVGRAVVVDNTAPTGSITIDDGASYTSQLTVTLNLKADDGSGELVGVQFTQDDASQFSEVEEFAPSREWVLDPGDGQKTVGVRFHDRAGNVSPTYTGSIILDTEPPGDWSRVDAGDSSRVMVGVVDHASGLDPSSAHYAVSNDGGYSWEAWRSVECDTEAGQEQVGACYLSADVRDGAVRFRIADRAGNEAYSPAYGEVIAPPTPESSPGTSPPLQPGPTTTPGGDEPAAAMPDLVVERVEIASQQGLDSVPVTVTVVIGNDGTVDAEMGFWVGLFIDPPIAPTVNSAFGPDGDGALWYVPNLAAFETQTLSLKEVDDRYSTFSGRLSPGTHELYVYVDSYNTDGEVGLVAEGDENNNVMGPVTVEVGEPSGNGGSEPAGAGPGHLVRLLIKHLEEWLTLLRGRL
jgi:hypothetical protein